MRPLLVALLTLGALPAAAQDADPRLRTLARWTEQARRGTPDPPIPDARELQCRQRPPSCACGGLPAGPTPRPTNQNAVLDHLLACAGSRSDGHRHPVGRIELELRIAPRGRVWSVRVVADDIGDPQLSACVRAALLRTRYEPARRGERVVRWPLVFTPPPDEEAREEAEPA